MIAVARIMMKDVNIAASTAMQVLDPTGASRRSWQARTFSCPI